ncbi:MAG: 50S ribosomal protein L10 [Candidatus Korarchaeota archaeon]|nr:50S ribosomal protein L10 [Candidatus Korarchaeota archaeon]NIU83450.1 50S ribosomal protein L10 [Candidatus Thorarchaeota archaeon]NIW13726.1 50S ribosomal protein L10 [Candidatus Thorarchaeota archaeon]NIW51821.1 50S ribosomal protein L10 [Candidatus Korarchaeota archaeon]
MSVTYERKEPIKEKRQRVQDLTEFFSKYDSVLVLDIEGVPANMLQNVREKLWKLGELRIVKNRLTKIAIDQVKDQKFEKLKGYLTHMRGLFFTNEDIFKAARAISDITKKLPPKPGKTSPKDVIIEKGGTGLKTGPEMRDLRVAGLPIRIIEGEIFIKEDTTLVSRGEEISPREAKAMNVLGIKPLEAKIRVVAGLQDGKLIERESLILSLREYKEMLSKGITKALNLTIETQLPTKEVVSLQLRRAIHVGFAIGVKASIPAPETLESILSSAYKFAQSVEKKTSHAGE